MINKNKAGFIYLRTFSFEVIIKSLQNICYTIL